METVEIQTIVIVIIITLALAAITKRRTNLAKNNISNKTHSSSLPGTAMAAPRCPPSRAKKACSAIKLQRLTMCRHRRQGESSITRARTTRHPQVTLRISRLCPNLNSVCTSPIKVLQLLHLRWLSKAKTLQIVV